MNSKNRGLPAGFGDSFKGLPVAERMNVLLNARELLEEQREKKALLEESGEDGEGRKEKEG